MPEYTLEYSEEYDNHVDEDGNALSDLLGDGEVIDNVLYEGEYEYVETYYESESDEEETRDYEYHYDDDEGLYVCDDCEYSNEHESVVKGHYTRKHAE